MTTTLPTTATRRTPRIDEWRPEDPDFWNRTGARIARRNLVVSVLTEHIGFSVWSLWSALVLFLGPAYGIDPAGKFLLTAVPTAVGASLRIPYTYAVARFGGRNWTIITALALLIPLVTTAVVLHPGISYTTLLVLGALAGVGGGNFASSMSNINSFYPQHLKGRALGFNAGGGNVGVASVQLVALLVLATAGAAHPRVLIGIYIPLVVLGALAAALWMNNLPTAPPADSRPMRQALREGHTWAITALYIGSFGSFIGFGFAFGQVLQVQFHAQFDTPLKAVHLTFLGPLLGSLARPIGGRLADKFGGAKVTCAAFAAMAGAALVVLLASEQHSLPVFLGGFIALFILSGIANGSVYKMIPGVFSAVLIEEPKPKREAIVSAVIGLVGAIGAFGGVLVNMAFRQTFLTSGNGNAAYAVFLGYYAFCLVLAWWCYVRPAASRRLTGV